MEVIAPTGKSAYTGVRDAATQEGSATAEFELTTKTGRAIWTRISARQLLDDEGGCAGGFAVVTDITDWKRTEEALRESEERFRVSLMHAPVVVFQQDLELRYTWVYNPLGGLVSEDIVGKTDEDIYPPEDVERVTSLKREVLSTGVGRREEGWVRVGGHVMWLDRTIEPLRDEHGDIVGITGASFDITERKSADQELQRAKEEIEGRVDQRLEQSNAYDLTFRELTVLHLVVDGKTDKEIGATLGISPLTVSKHVSNILAKMDVESRTAAGAQAIREGLVS